MASRGELIQMCLELEVDGYEKMTIEGMKAAVRDTADKKYNRKYPISPKGLSDALLKFLYMEYDYVLVDKDGKRHDWEGNSI